MEYQYFYNNKGERVEINELNFMVPCSLDPLKLTLFFQNEKYIKEMEFMRSSPDSRTQGSSCIYICYIYACNLFAAYLEEDDEEDVLRYKNTFKKLFPRILFFSRNDNAEKQYSCSESLKEIQEFKNFPDKIKWLFYLSVARVQSICSGCFKNSPILLKKYRKSHKKCSHEFNYANLFLNSLFSEGLLPRKGKNTTNVNFWKI